MRNATDYDVIIMGAGFAGICQARHILLKVPDARIALIDPRPRQRRDKDMKIGESTVEIAADFMCRELGLHSYMVENHVTKLGLSFHWPKRIDKTDSLEDYLHIWTHNQPFSATFQLNRAKFETDVLEMTCTMGAEFVQGKVSDVELPPGDAPNAVKVKTADGVIELTAKHVVDAAGRKFIIGKKKDNLIFDPEELYGLNNASAWTRIRGADRSRFHSGYDPEGPTFVSKYYATNQFFGHGHWVWMIPTCCETNEVSIGVVYHKDVINSERFSTRDKFFAFLKENHRALYDFATTGEPLDYFNWSRIAHASKEMFSPDNWYVVGDAAYLYDPFYSYGTSVAALTIEGITEVIRADLAGEPGVEEKRDLYNKFNLVNSRFSNYLIRDHHRQLGAADVMSWRIYFEYMWWFGLMVPMHAGKWHLDPTFVKRFVPMVDTILHGIFAPAYDQLNELLEKNKSIGLMDCYRADQLLGGYAPIQRFEDYLENAKLAPQRLNIFKSLKWTAFYVAVWNLKLLWTGYGLRGVINPWRLRRLWPVLRLGALSIAGDFMHRFQTRNTPANATVAKMRREFESYTYQPELQPWT